MQTLKQLSLASMANRGASSSSAPFTKSWKYHVFLSFRGFDTRSNFTGHLYSALRLQGINTFMDDDELRRGEEISNALLTAIEDSKISVVVFSKNYASSKWCLDELVKILDCKESNQQLVIPVFYKVTPSDVRNHRGSFGDALANMDCNDVEKVNRWKKALSQAGKLAGFTLSDEHGSESEAELIHKIVQHISREVIDRTYLYVTEYPVRMHRPVEDITKLLDLGVKDVRMVGVWGTGGIGKTTIATAVYNSIAHEFEGSSFLVNVKDSKGGGLAKLQRTLLYEILRDTNLEVANVHKGATMIKQRLSCRKVLLVLDDVDDMEQLHKLVGACDWFGVGSRIIITTRDKQLLTAHHVNLIHEVKILDDPEALDLFCWHAFKKSGPPLGDYVKLAERAIRYAQGLPLALEVLGCCLCGGSIDKWEAALDGFKSTKIQDVLKISYNALDHSVQEVFLDIACFFKGKDRSYAIKTLAACGLNASYSIEVLIEKALISVEHGNYVIWMHDLLEEMGKDIVKQESPTEPGRRSRLWFHEDVKHVLTNNTGTNKITGIMLNFPKQDDEIFLDVGRSFSKMKNLKLLINHNISLYGDASSIPNNLRVLEWHGCPFQFFPPNFRPNGLVVLSLPYSRIKQLGEGLKHMKKLTSLNFTGSQFLTEIPDLSSSPNLRYLNASDCQSLVEVHPSVGYLDKLEELYFCNCCELTKFPNKVGLKSLKLFYLSGCIKLESFPKIVGKMESLIKLGLGRTAIKELTASIGHLIGLKVLDLSESSIKELPTSIGHLIGLKLLDLSRSAIKELPASIGHLIGLQTLKLSRSAIKELPASIGHLIGLQTLSLYGSAIKELPASRVKSCMNHALSLPYSRIKQLGEGLKHMKKLVYLNFTGSQFLTEIPDLSSSPNLRYLYASDCQSLVEVHPSVGYLDKLEELYFCGCCELTKFPNKVGLKSLKIFYLSGCIKLESFPEIVGKMESLIELYLAKTAIKELPASIGHLIGLNLLYLSDSAIKELPASIGHLIGLELLDLSETAIKELPSSVGHLTALESLFLEGCKNLANLPQSIYGLQNLNLIVLDRCPKVVTLPNNLISKGLSSAKSLPLEVLAFQECNLSNIDSLENFCCSSNLWQIDLSESNFISLPVCISKCVNLKELNLSGCKRLVEILVQLPASIAKIYVTDCISLERFSTLSKILEDEDMQGIRHMDLSNCHRLCDNLGLDLSKMANFFLNQMKRSERIIVTLPNSGSEVPEWFTFGDDFDDYDESKFDYVDDDGRSVRNYKLPIEIPWTSVLENTKLVLFAVWEITESFVSPCHLLFNLNDYRVMYLSGRETGEGNVWLECIPISYVQLKTSSFRVTVFGEGLHIKSIGAHLAPISMSKDDDDDVGDELRPRKRTKI